MIFAISLAPYAILVLTGYADDDRYILPFTPIFALAVSGLLTLRHATLRTVAVALIVTLVAVQMVALGQLDRLMMRPDTRELARTWIDEHVPRNEGILANMRAMTFEQSARSVELTKEVAPASLTYLQRRRLAGATVSSGGSRERDAFHLQIAGPEAFRTFEPRRLFERFRAEGYRWYVVDDLTSPNQNGDFYELLRLHLRHVASIEPGPADVRAPIFNLTNQFKVGGPFNVFRVHHLGPRIDIYRID
jgi:hypothetical protein